MGELIGIIGIAYFIFGYLIPSIETNKKLDYYDHTKTDNSKLTSDMLNGVSVYERRIRCVNGHYDKDKTSQ